MMTFTLLRLLVYAKRISASLDSISDSLAALARVAESDWEEKHAPRRAVQTSIGTFDREKVSNEWEKNMEERFGSQRRDKLRP